MGIKGNMVRQGEEPSKDEKKIAKGKMEGKSLQFEGVQRAPELLVSQVLTQEKGQNKDKKKSKLVGLVPQRRWRKKESKEESRDMEEVVHWTMHLSGKSYQ